MPSSQCCSNRAGNVRAPPWHLDGPIASAIEQRQQGLGEPGQVPLRDRRLVAVGVAAAVVDRAEHGRGIVGVHERARAVVDRLAGERHVVGVHHAVDEADELPAGDQARLPFDDRAKTPGTARGASPAPGSGARSRSRPAPAAPRILVRRGLLHRADADVARGHARQDGPVEHATRGRPARRSSTTARLRVVGMPSACIASLMMYSRSIGPSAARPSPRRENRVAPRPLQLDVDESPDGVSCSPSRMARPSPSIVKWPNWCPA